MALDVTTPHAFNIRAAAVNPVPVNTSPHAVILVPVPGGQGPTGPAGDGAQVFGETLTGTRNGTNLVFATANPYRTASTAVYRNGLREMRGVGYTESAASEITFTTAPESTDDITVDYLIA